MCHGCKDPSGINHCNCVPGGSCFLCMHNLSNKSSSKKETPQPPKPKYKEPKNRQVSDSITDTGKNPLFLPVIDDPNYSEPTPKEVDGPELIESHYTNYDSDRDNGMVSFAWLIISFICLIVGVLIGKAGWGI